MRDFTASSGSIRRALVGPDIGHCVSRRRIILALTINQQNCSAAEVSRLQSRQLAEMPPGSSEQPQVRQLPVKRCGSHRIFSRTTKRKSHFPPISPNVSALFKHLIWQPAAMEKAQPSKNLRAIVGQETIDVINFDQYTVSREHLYYHTKYVFQSYSKLLSALNILNFYYFH